MENYLVILRGWESISLWFGSQLNLIVFSKTYSTKKWIICWFDFKWNEHSLWFEKPNPILQTMYTSRKECILMIYKLYKHCRESKNFYGNKSVKMVCTQIQIIGLVISEKLLFPYVLKLSWETDLWIKVSEYLVR